ncbi:hybrid sensor histidine kinase/response regulator [Rhizobium rhizogenes]|uniref:hybrid sensor histidine kinase/response regulator n=1 Tax=Rhizobium rhizogenes TaxID=359 RepID=UPI001573EDF8|nr:hybrid sensor histidine kinase/response regulator [Rhizobium rhizogenes]NTH22644.1 hybrid sensor histidine kinase/response regulator [Rhizobium rhizogenes]NTH35674.1 hybrid sensor histidine kinase/response regulator [Rhizobium rhizogenes]NTH81227.1 hybrid sensor histidine kinase/response regulator [Rhizobium rhizogenes]NTH87204.1 hybrid sensor histidine kinase/response regulator [Rhizobium rhizogenes]NTI78033.1 hybrid sensor histidine kinase/response regulator [Rhizobium rhizogenes]
MQDGKIRQALVELLYRNSYGVVVSNIVISLAAAYILRTAVSSTWLLGWLGGLYLLTAIRVLASRSFFSREREPGSIARWAWLAAAFSWISALLWGAMGWVGFLPEEPVVLSFTVIVLTGLVCGTVPSLSAFPPALIGSIIITVIPIALRCILSGSDMSGAFLFLLVSMVFINIYYCRITYSMLRETVALRLENEELVVSLQEERDRAQTADRSKTRFLAAASHDLRQPTHALSLLVSTLAILGQRGDVASRTARELAAKAKAVVGNLSGLLNALLDISRLDAGVVTVTKEPVSLNRLFAELRDEFANAAGERGLGWRTVDSTLSVDSDPIMLKRILDNLVSNAFRYSTKGRVLLGCRRRGASVEIQVWDTGAGIPADQQKAIFEEFVQLHNPERDRTQGLGLGLAIVRRTAQLLGHPLRLVSTEGRGSLFALTVPVAASVTSEARTDNSRIITESALAIAVIDDERDALDAISLLLETLGYRVYAGRSAAEACLAHAEASPDGTAPIDLVITDYRLEAGTTGIEAIEEVRTHAGRRLPAIILTGDTSPARLRQVTESGHLLLHKPVDAEQMQQAITELCSLQPLDSRGGSSKG